MHMIEELTTNISLARPFHSAENARRYSSHALGRTPDSISYMGGKITPAFYFDGIPHFVKA